MAYLFRLDGQKPMEPVKALHSENEKAQWDGIWSWVIDFKAFYPLESLEIHEWTIFNPNPHTAKKIAKEFQSKFPIEQTRKPQLSSSKICRTNICKLMKISINWIIFPNVSSRMKGNHTKPPSQILHQQKPRGKRSEKEIYKLQITIIKANRDTLIR